MSADETVAKLRLLPDGQRVGEPPADEAEHFIKCSACGGWIDCRRLDQVFAHEVPGHAAESIQ